MKKIVLLVLFIISMPALVQAGGHGFSPDVSTDALQEAVGFFHEHHSGLKPEDLDGPPVPVEFKMLRLMGGNVSYVYRKAVIYDLKDIKTVVSQIDDLETKNSIHAAQTAGDISTICFDISLVSDAAWLTMTLSSLHDQDQGLTNAFLVSMIATGISGIVLHDQSRDDAYDAIHNYNKALKAKDVTLLDLPLNQAIGLGLTQRF